MREGYGRTRSGKRSRKAINKREKKDELMRRERKAERKESGRRGQKKEGVI